MVWGPLTMKFGGIWRYFSTPRLKIDRPNDDWTGLWQNPCAGQMQTAVTAHLERKLLLLCGSSVPRHTLTVVLLEPYISGFE